MKTELQRIRTERGFKSARAFAEHIGVSARSYTNHEQGISSPPLDVACIYADALGVTLDELAGRNFDARAYEDSRHRQLNENYLSLDETAKDAAAAAVNGIATAWARGTSQEERPQAHSKPA